MLEKSAEFWNHERAKGLHGDDEVEALTSVKGQTGLPRYFHTVFDVATKLPEGRLDFVLPDGRRFRCGGNLPGEVAELRILNNDLFARMVREGELGFCEAYMDGWWDTPDLQALLDLIQRPANDAVNNGYTGQTIMQFYERLRFWLRRNSRRQAKANIAAHYDLGNEFYALWLDQSMTYSSALYADSTESMERAQERKYASMVDRMGVQPGDHVLEIGCGWGGFAEYAAGKRGLKVTALTISQAQMDYAVARIAKAGLSDRVEFRLQDYRDETGRYDGIASIEMFEAVGEAYWPIYFRTLHDRLKPGRQAVLQVITVAESRWESYRKNVDFIQKFIFPGGMLPTQTRLRDEGRKVGLSVQDAITFGESYSLTLRRWRETFTARWDEVSRLGFDARFRRMWDFYLTSCAGAFQGGNCDVTQITFSRPEK